MLRSDSVSVRKHDDGVERAELSSSASLPVRRAIYQGDGDVVVIAVSELRLLSPFARAIASITALFRRSRTSALGSPSVNSVSTAYTPRAIDTVPSLAINGRRVWSTASIWFGRSASGHGDRDLACQKPLGKVVEQSFQRSGIGGLVDGRADNDNGGLGDVVQSILQFRGAATGQKRITRNVAQNNQFGAATGVLESRQYLFHQHARPGMGER